MHLFRFNEEQHNSPWVEASYHFVELHDRTASIILHQFSRFSFNFQYSLWGWNIWWHSNAIHSSTLSLLLSLLHACAHVCTHMHTHATGPNDLYSSPVTTQQEYGWWSSQDDCKPQPWTRTKKHPLVNSEMTRCVVCCIHVHQSHVKAPVFGLLVQPSRTCMHLSEVSP